jgi:hypothetical protein
MKCSLNFRVREIELLRSGLKGVLQLEILRSEKFILVLDMPK